MQKLISLSHIQKTGLHYANFYEYKVCSANLLYGGGYAWLKNGHESQLKRFGPVKLQWRSSDHSDARFNTNRGGSKLRWMVAAMVGLDSNMVYDQNTLIKSIIAPFFCNFKA